MILPKYNVDISWREQLMLGTELEDLSSSRFGKKKKKEEEELQLQLQKIHEEYVNFRQFYIICYILLYTHLYSMVFSSVQVHRARS